MDSQTGIRRWFASDGKRKMLILRDTSSSGGISSISAVPPITALTVTGATVISTSISSGVLVGRYSGGSGIMEEITIGSGLSLSGGGVLTATGGSGSYDVFYVNLTQVSPNDYTGTASNFTAYSVNAVYFFVFDIVPSGVNAIRVNLNSTSYITIVKPAGGNLPATAITLTTAPYEFAYNGTNFVPESRVKITGEGDALSSITAAIATNSIDSSNYAQTWAWSTASTQTPFTWTANALSTGTLFTLSSTSTAGDESKLLQLTRSGANAGSGKKNYGLYSAITNTGTTSTNVAGFFSASGGTTNYGIQSDSVENLYRDSIGVTSTDSLYILNNTAAAAGAGAQQWSPRIRMRGNSWKTAATAATQTVDWIQEVQTFRGLGNAKGRLTFSASQNGGAYTRVAQLTSGGGLILGNNTYSETSGANEDLSLWLITGQNNNVTAYGNETILVYGRSNTTTNSTFCIGLSNTNSKLDYIFGNSNISTSGAGASYIYGDTNTSSGAVGAGYVVGSTNALKGGYIFGLNNDIASGGHTKTQTSFGFGANNTISGSGGTNNDDGGEMIFGYLCTINPPATQAGGIMVFGSGVKMASTINANAGTFNWGWNNSGTDNRPGMQFRSIGKNILTIGTETTATNYDTSAVNAFVMKNGTAWNTGSIITDTSVYYVGDIAAGQASPHFITEDAGIFAIGTARVGWRSNTNLNLVSNNTVYAKLLTTGYLELVTGLKLDGATSGALTMIAAGTTTSYTVTMPSAQGGSGTYLKNDGSGNLSWDAPSGSGTVTSIATAGLISGGTITSSGTITTSMSTGKLVGRSTAGTGVMEEITVGSGLTLSGGTLSASGGGGGDFVLISSQDASASATIDFTGLSSTYSTYKIIISNMVSSTNKVIPSLRVGTGGTPTYQTGNVYSWIRIYSAGTVVSDNNTSDSKILIGSNGTQSSTATQSHNMEITIVNPSQSTDYHHVYGKISFIDSAGGFVMQDFVGVYLSTTAVTAIRIYMSSGNIASGKFNLYGIT